MEIVLIKALQLICCLSLLVFIHEGGHFLFAKFSGVKVEKFYLFFFLSGLERPVNVAGSSPAPGPLRGTPSQPVRALLLSPETE